MSQYLKFFTVVICFVIPLLSRRDYFRAVQYRGCFPAAASLARSEVSGASSATFTVKILKIGTPEIITIIVLQLEQLDFTVQYCVQKMQTE